MRIEAWLSHDLHPPSRDRKVDGNMSNSPRPSQEETGSRVTAPIPPQLVEQELERVLSSPTFAQSQRLIRFLRFIVEHYLKNEADQLKEYRLGVSVFDRNESYDPRTDPIVRVEASRLRTKLREYYDSEGKDNPIQIEMPKGSYAPVVVLRSSHLQTAPEHWRLRENGRLLMLLVTVVSLSLAGYSYFRYREARQELQRRQQVEPLAPEFRAFWSRFLTPGVETSVVFGSPIFFASPDHSLFLRPYDINEPHGLESNPTFQRLRERFGNLAGPRYDYALLGEMLAVSRLTDFFARGGGSVTALPSYKTTWDAIQNGNIILLGAPRMNHLLRHFPRPLDFEWDENDNIRNRKPRPSEPEIYLARFHEGFHDRPRDAQVSAHTYAIVASLPGLRPNREMLLVSVHGGPGLWEAVDHLTRPETMRSLAEQLQFPTAQHAHFQMLLRIYVDRGIPIRTEYVTHHTFEAPADGF
jgi:hypothetical protein